MDLFNDDDNEEHLDHLLCKYNVLSYSKRLAIKMHEDNDVAALLTARHWQKIESAQRLDITLDKFNSLSTENLEIIRHLFTKDGVQIGIDYNIEDTTEQLSSEFLDLLDSVECLVTCSACTGYEEDVDPLYMSRLFDIIYKHRQTLTFVWIDGYNQDFQQRWLNTLDEFPRTTYNMLYGNTISESDLPLYFSKLSNGQEIAPMSQVMTQIITTEAEVHHFIRYVERSKGLKAVNVSFNSERLLQTVAAYLFQCPHITDISIFDGRGSGLFMASVFQGFSVAPNLIELDLGYNNDSDQDLNVITTIISDGLLPNLLKLSVQFCFRQQLTEEAIKAFFDAVYRHPTLQILKVRPHHLEELILVPAIKQSRSLQKITIFSNAEHNCHFDIIHKHRQTLTSLSINGYDSKFRQRWLHTLDEFPLATHNYLCAGNVINQIPEADLPLFYSKLSSDKVIAQTNHSISTDIGANHLIGYLDKSNKSATQSNSIKYSAGDQPQSHVKDLFIGKNHFSYTDIQHINSKTKTLYSNQRSIVNTYLKHIEYYL
eukprot:gene8390-9870_t